MAGIREPTPPSLEERRSDAGEPPGGTAVERPGARSVTRRRLLAAGIGAGAAAALGGGVVGGLRLLNGGERAGGVRHFVSRPDLEPPAVTVETAAAGTAPGYVFLTPVSPGQDGPLVVDDEGEPVWFRPVTGRGARTLYVQRYQDEPVLTWWEGKDEEGGYGNGEWLLVDGGYREVARVKAAGGLMADFHELLLTPRGTALLVAYGAIVADLRAIGGSRRAALLEGVVQEVDVASGRLLFQWRSSEHVDPAESYRRLRGDAREPFDYFHINSVGVAPDGNLLVSARHTSAVYKLDRKSGAVIWRLGGKRSDFRMPQATRFWGQHDARARDAETISLFDNGTPPEREESSRGIVLSLDGRRVRLARQYLHPRRLLAGAMGNMQPLADGGYFIGWGSEPYFSEFGEDGRLRFDARLPERYRSYRAHRATWNGRPAAGPAVAVRLEDGSARAYASWNGATEVAYWAFSTRRRGGDETRQVVRRTGFETAIEIAPDADRVSVTALDAARRRLRAAPPIAL